MTVKKLKLIFWTTTVIIFLIDGLLPAVTSQSILFKDVIRHLGYPLYFGNLLTVFKILGAVVLILHKIPGRIKEWAYAGFTFDLLFAFTSHTIVDGFDNFQPVLLLVILGILAASYFSYHQLQVKAVSKPL